MDSVLTCMVSDRLGPGELLQDFGKNLSSLFGGSQGIAVREYARAIDLAFQALSCGEGSTVLISPLAPDSYREVLEASDYTAVYCDVDPSDGTIDTEAATRIIQEQKIDVVVTTAPLGITPDLASILELGIPVIEDVSHSLGAQRGELKAGSAGRVVVLSLEPDDIITTGGGAAVIARGPKERSALKRALDAASSFSLLPDMNAALGIAQLKELPRYLARRSEIAERFSGQVLRSSRHRGLVSPATEGASGYLYPVLLSSSVKDVIAYAKKNEVEVIPAFDDSIVAAFTRAAQSQAESTDAQESSAANPLDAEQYPSAYNLFLRCVLFPLYPSLTNKEVEHLGKVLSTLP